MRTSAKRSARTLTLVYAALVAMFAAACAGQNDGNDPAQPSTPWAAPSNSLLSHLPPVAETALPGEASSAPISEEPGASGDEKVGCTHVQFCNVPSSSIGTRCVVDNGNCDVCKTVRECQDDTKFVCGSPVSVWTIRYAGVDYSMTDFLAQCDH